MRTEKKQSVGLDFGTTTTMVATAGGLRPIGEYMQPWMPSLVGCGDDGAVLVGEKAADLPDPQIVRSIKRSITEWRDFVRVDLPTGIRDVRADDWIVHVLEEVARRGAEKGAAMSGDVVLRLGCPAMWDGKQRRRLLTAAQSAGLSVTLDGLVDEPVAAGIAWLAANSTGPAGPQRVLVFDMGGGTLDVAVLDVRGVNRQDVSVLAAVGVAEAGDALDEAIAADLDFVLARSGIDVDSLRRPDLARDLLLRAARETKVRLSTEEEDPILLDRTIFGPNEISYSRDELNEIFQPQLDRAEQYVAAALRIARLVEDVAGSAYEIARLPIETLVSSVDVVVLSGGMSRIPYVKQRMQELFPDAVVAPASEAPEDAVSIGLAKAGQYGRINMYRPAFDVLVEWDGGFRTIYEAFTPLVEAWQIARGGSDLRYLRNGLDLSLPRSGRGKLRVVSHAGERVRATLGGESLDGFPVALSEQNFEFSIYPNGRIRLVDAGGRHEGRIEDWYAMQGQDHGDRLKRITEQRQPEVPVPYPFNRERD